MESEYRAQRGGLPGKNGSPRLNLPRARAWKEFGVTEIFDVRNTHCVQKTWIEDFDGTVPYVTASSENNSIDSYVSYRPEMIDKGNAIVIGGKTFVVTYQKHDFFSNDSHNLILRIKRKDCSERAYLFLVAVINRGLGSKYSWGDSVSFRKIQKDKVTLPVTANGDIDIVYMDAYIRELENARVCELENWLVAAGFDDCELSLKEKLAVESCQSGKMKTGEFAVGDLFVVKSNPQLNKESFKFTSTSEYPYFTRTVFNNGILGNVEYLDEVHKIDGGSLAVGMLGMQFFYMEHDFYAGQFTKTVFLKDGGRLDEKLALWFASLFNKAKGHFQKGLVRDFERLFLSLKIQLPVRPNGKPDFDTMRDLISGVMKLSIRGVVEWKDREIAATKKSFSSSSDSMSTVVVPADGFIGMNAEEYLEAAGLPQHNAGDEYTMPPEEPLA